MSRALTALVLLAGCNEIGIADTLKVPIPTDSGDAGALPGVDTDMVLPALAVEPAHHDFGLVDVGVTEQTRVRVANVGRAPLTVTDVVYTTDDGELSLGTHDPLPWTLQAGDYRDLDVTYVPDDGSPDRGTVRVSTIEVPAREAVQEGTGKAFEGFSTGWYVYDDGVAHETTSNPAYTVDQHGDEDLYWYEPSGAHGMTDSTDVAGDFATLRRYVVDAAGPPVQPTEPFDYNASSTLATFEYATCTYFLCDFYVDATEDPARYTFSVGPADDGVRVIVNGTILGGLRFGEPGTSWNLGPHIRLGEVNTVVAILADDSEFHKYVRDLAFYRDGVLVLD
jgi:hypothetical protein